MRRWPAAPDGEASIGIDMHDKRLGFPKEGLGLLDRKNKSKTEDDAWDACCEAVDKRDRRICQITGKPLSAATLDPWLKLARHHLEMRSKSKARRASEHNVLTVSWAIHQLIHRGALLLLDKRGRKCLDVRQLDHVAWNRNIVVRGDEPVRITKWPVLKD